MAGTRGAADTIAPPMFSSHSEPKGVPVPDLTVTVLSAGDPAQHQVTTGTKAWELFADDRDVIAARVDGELRDLSVRAGRRRRGRAGADRLRRRPRHPAALHRARAGAGGAGPVPRREARHRPADRRRLLLRLRRRASRSRPTTSSASRRGCARSSRRASGSPAGSSPTTRRATSCADEPYKLELIGLKGQPDDGRRRSASRSVRGELTIYDNVDRDGEVAWEGPLPRPAPADHQAHPGVHADAHRRGVLAGRARRTRSCSASTAPRGSRRRRSTRTCTGSRRPPARDHRRLGPSSTCSASPTRSAPGCAVFHPKGGVLRKVMEDYSRRRHDRGRVRVRLHPAHHQGAAVRDLGAPATGTPTACTRRCTSTRARRRRHVRGRGRTTTSSR